VGKKLVAYLYALLAAFFWGSHTVVMKHLVDTGVSPFLISVARLYLAGLLIALFFRFSGGKFVFGFKKNKLTVVLVASFVLNFLFFPLGLMYTTASSAKLLEDLYPFFVALLLVTVFHKKVSLMEWFAIGMATFGTFLVVSSKPGFSFALEGSLLGDLIELAAAFVLGVFVVASKEYVGVAAKTTPEKMLFLSRLFLVSALILTPTAFLQSFVMDLTVLAWLFFLAVFPTVVSYTLWFKSLDEISVISAVLVVNLSIVFTMINSWLFLGEEFSELFLLGAFLILAGLLVSASKGKS